MTRKRTSILCPRDPIGLRVDEAAAFVGMSPSLFRRAVSEGVMPCPHEFKNAVIWNADELAKFFCRLPRSELWLKPGMRAPHDDWSDDDDRWDVFKV